MHRARLAQTKVAGSAIAQRQLVAICRALAAEVRLVMTLVILRLISTAASLLGVSQFLTLAL